MLVCKTFSAEFLSRARSCSGATILANYGSLISNSKLDSATSKHTILVPSVQPGFNETLNKDEVRS